MVKRRRGIVKGAPSGLVVSLILHAAAFLLAGLFVVFTVVQKQEQKFVPPKAVERPKMKLKKPTVKMRKNVKPKASNRIVTKVKRSNMPNIQLPEMSGLSDGLGSGGIGSMELLPEFETISMLGSAQSTGSDLVGTYYDFTRDRNGRDISMDVVTWRHEIIKFLRGGWRTSDFTKYYRAPRKVYATCLVVPPVLSSIAPSTFGDKDAAGVWWLVHYKGQIVYPRDITFRFWGQADETMAVRVGGKMVLGVRWENSTGYSNVDPDTIPPNLWRSDSLDTRKYFMGNTLSVVGDWITLKAGEPQDIEIVIGDNGGQACFMLAVQEQGVEYERNVQGGPLLPAFKTTKLSHDLIDAIYKNLVPGEISLTNGPVFNDFVAVPSSATAPEPAAPMAAPEAAMPPAPPKLRPWTLANGQSLEGELINVMGSQAVLKDAKGKTLKVPVDELSVEDRIFIELAKPPTFKIDKLQDCKQMTFLMGRNDANQIRPPEDRCHYGIRVQQQSAGEYPHRVNVEFFIIGRERLGDKYILFDRQSTSFVPSSENGRRHEFMSAREVVLENYAVDNEPRGEYYMAYLAVLTDERGEVIGVGTSADWLYENYDNLKQRYAGNYMDKNCLRTYPTRPPRTRY